MSPTPDHPDGDESPDGDTSESGKESDNVPLSDDALSDDALLLAKQFAASRSNGDGTSTLRVCLADDTMTMVMAAIDTKVHELITDMTQNKELTRRQAIDHHGGYPALRARALATVITDGGVETTVMLTIPIDTLDSDNEEPAPSDTEADSEEPKPSDNVPPQPDDSQQARPESEAAHSTQTPQPQTDADADADADADEAQQAPPPPPEHQADNPQQPPPPLPPEPQPTVGQLAGIPDRLRSTVARLLCDCRINMTVVDEYGGPLSIGRRSRVIPNKIRTALVIRDHGICRFPGCGSTRNLQAHHVVHWQHGGPTELGNLVLLCWFHHDLLHNQASNDARSVTDHQGCWTVEPVPSGESKAGGWFRFRTPRGQLATVEHSRGSVNALYWYNREHPSAWG